ncbi:MAG: hypothetical protein K2J30_05470 [Clostridia bacterium]|nr:hypothetical protein [Clostridia bacterium]
MKKRMKVATVAMAASLCAIAGVAWVAQPSKASNASAFEQGYVRPYIHDDGKTLTESTVSYLSVGKKKKQDMRFQLETRTSYQNVDGVKYIEQIEVVITYDWERIPVSLREDAIVVSWDQKVFCLLSDSFYSCDTTILERQPLIGKSTFYEEKFEQTRPMGLDTYSSNHKDIGELTYEAKLSTKYKGNRRLSVKELRGYASFVLIPTKSFTSLAEQSFKYRSTVMIAHYYHTRNVFWKATQTREYDTLHFDTTQVGLNGKYSL